MAARKSVCPRRCEDFGPGIQGEVRGSVHTGESADAAVYFVQNLPAAALEDFLGQGPSERVSVLGLAPDIFQDDALP
jgi:hypothetical protein